MDSWYMAQASSPPQKKPRWILSQQWGKWEPIQFILQNPLNSSETDGTNPSWKQERRGEG